VVTAMVWWADRYLPVSVPDYSQVGSLSFTILAALDQVAIFGVPVFLFVSGYFIAIATGPNRKTVGWNTVLNRLKTLIIPYLIWSAFILAFNMFNGKDYNLVSLLWAFEGGKAAAPLYYVPMLVQFYVFAPLIVPLVKRWWIPSLLVSVVFMVIAVYFPYMAFLHREVPRELLGLRYVAVNWRSMEFSFWFALGTGAGFHVEAFKQFLAKYRKLFVAGVLVMLPVAMVEWELLRRSYGHEWISTQDTVTSKIFVLLLLLTYLAFDQVKFPFSRQLDELGKRSFGIYLVHYPVQEVAARGVAVLFPAFLGYYFLFQFYLVLAGLFVPITLMWVTQHTPARRIYHYLFG
jgi:surface polysaccharide O-acyltransferase-like enzyme